MTLPPPIIVPAARLRDFPTGAGLEWLEPDGRGGYASATSVGANTRCYHGLLVVARRPPTDRVVLLSRFEEALVTPTGDRYDLGASLYDPGVVHPHGHRMLEEFRLDPWPIWRYRLGGLTLTKILFVAREPGATVLIYRLEGGAGRLELRPLVAGRDFHAVVRANDEIAPAARAEPGRVVYEPYPGVPGLVLSFEHGEWRGEGFWYYDFAYPRETERGLHDREDLYSPGVLTASIAAGESWALGCATAPVEIERAGEWLERERRRRTAIAAAGRRIAPADPAAATLAARLALAADAFLVRRGAGWSILAGYPWFADWGRDAMISLPGLCLATGRLREAGDVLVAFAEHLRDGLIPNRFPDYGGQVPLDHYNAADASLWFVEAVAAFGEAGGDVCGLWPAVREILERYRLGTHFGIRMDDDGLITQGEAGVQLTWMDARVDDWVVTPRAGKAVEINALWYNALRKAARLARAMGDDRGATYDEIAHRVEEAFDAFWYADGGYLYDVIDGSGRPDPTLRPNQLLAISLPHSPVRRGRAASALAVVERELLVPLAVRTLAPGSPEYRGDYLGDRMARDAAYHQGTAWPWLLGPFASAYVRVHGDGPTARRRVWALLEPITAHLHVYGLGHVAEVVSGDPPYRPGGCFAQAWSCAEPLRILHTLGRLEGQP